jgi:hypothetical protein
VIASRLATPIDYLVVGSSRLIDLERAVERARLALDQGEVEEARAVLEEVRLPPP